MIYLSIDRQLVDDDYEDETNYLDPEQVVETRPTLSAALERVAEISRAGYGYSVVGLGEGGPDAVEITVDGQTDVDMVEVVGHITLEGSGEIALDPFMVWDAMNYEDKCAMPDLRYGELRESLLAVNDPDYRAVDELDTFLQAHERFWSAVDPDGDDPDNPAREEDGA